MPHARMADSQPISPPWHHRSPLPAGGTTSSVLLLRALRWCVRCIENFETGWPGRADTTPPALVRTGTDRVASDLRNRWRSKRTAAAPAPRSSGRDGTGRDVCASFLLRSGPPRHWGLEIVDRVVLHAGTSYIAADHESGVFQPGLGRDVGTGRDETRRRPSQTGLAKWRPRPLGFPDEDCRFGALFMLYLYRAFYQLPTHSGKIPRDHTIQPSIPVPELLLFWNLDGCPWRSNRQEQKRPRLAGAPKLRSIDPSTNHFGRRHLLFCPYISHAVQASSKPPSTYNCINSDTHMPAVRRTTFSA